MSSPDWVILERAMQFIQDSPAPKLAAPDDNSLTSLRALSAALNERIDAWMEVVVKLEAKLQEGIDGGQRAKAELDSALEAIAEQSATRMQGHENRLEKLEDKAGSLGEWQEAVDERINETYGRLLEVEAELPAPLDPPPATRPMRLEFLDYRGTPLLSLVVPPGEMWVEPPDSTILGRTHRIVVTHG